MKLQLNRAHGTKGFTHGKLFVDGKYFCDTLEDEERPVKIPNITAIRTGTYAVIVSMSVRFRRLMPLLLNVPNFTGIRIHAGNTAKHTEGCILVGTFNQVGYIKDSRIAFNRLMKVLTEAQNRGVKIEIEIK